MSNNKHTQVVDFSNPNADKIISGSTQAPMSNNKQSSMEWLKSTVKSMIEQGGDADLHAVLWHIEQAKAMEKKQCVDFALKCMLNGLEPHKSTREAVEKLFDEYFNNSDG